MTGFGVLEPGRDISVQCFHVSVSLPGPAAPSLDRRLCTWRMNCSRSPEGAESHCPCGQVGDRFRSLCRIRVFVNGADSREVELTIGGGGGNLPIMVTWWRRAGADCASERQRVGKAATAVAGHGTRGVGRGQRASRDALRWTWACRSGDAGESTYRSTSGVIGVRGRPVVVWPEGDAGSCGWGRSEVGPMVMGVPVRHDRVVAVWTNAGVERVAWMVADDPHKA